MEYDDEALAPGFPCVKMRFHGPASSDERKTMMLVVIGGRSCQPISIFWSTCRTQKLPPCHVPYPEIWSCGV